MGQFTALSGNLVPLVLAVILLICGIAAMCRGELSKKASPMARQATRS